MALTPDYPANDTLRNSDVTLERAKQITYLFEIGLHSAVINAAISKAVTQAGIGALGVGNGQA